MGSENDEMKLVSQFLDEVGNMDKLTSSFPDMSQSDIAKLFIISRKFNLKRAVQLYKEHVNMRKVEDLNYINPMDKGVHRELVSGKFTILTSTNDNPSLAIFTESTRLCNWSNYKDAVRALIFQLDVAVRSDSLMRNGLNVIYNMSDSSYTKFDFDLCTRVLKLLKGKYPAPLKFVMVISAPIWFSAPYNVLKLFVSEKMRKRIFITDQNGLKTHMPIDSIPVIFGGTRIIDHKEWIKHCFKVQRIDNQIPENYFSNVPILSQPNDNSWKCRLTRRSSLQNNPNSSTSLISNKSTAIWHAKNGDSFESQKRTEIRRTSDPQSNLMDNSSNSLQDNDTSSLQDLSAFQPTMPGISLSEFKEYMHSLSSYDILGREYGLEFFSSTIDRRNHIFFSLSKNKSKNRYMDVVCLDHKRVDLPDKTYIHANYVDSYLQKNAYICSQGPLESTVRDFYQMIFHTKVPIVVMTTGYVPIYTSTIRTVLVHVLAFIIRSLILILNLFTNVSYISDDDDYMRSLLDRYNRILEGKTRKCANYLPASENKTIIFGEFKVSIKETNFFVTYRLTEVEIFNSKTNTEHKCFHYHFLNWPDYGIPESPKEFIDFIELVHNHYNRLINDQYNYESELETYYLSEGKPPPPPILVHCSAGIGRTGTFVTIAVNQKRAKYEGKVNIKETLKIVRTQRSGAIQMPQQYIFCFVAILHYIENTCSS